MSRQEVASGEASEQDVGFRRVVTRFGKRIRPRLTASTFVAIFTFSWVVSFLVDYLISLHKVQSAISTMVDKLEVGLFCWDFVWCGLLISRDMIKALLKGGRGQINVEEDV